jgi:adenylate cyclase
MINNDEGFIPSLIQLAYEVGGGKNIFKTGKSDIIIGRVGVDLDFSFANDVSRRHVRIFLNGGKFFVEDLGSKWGTLLNGTEIKGQGHQVLRAGDVLILSVVEVKVERLDVEPVIGAEDDIKISKSVDAGFPAELSVAGNAADITRRLSLLYELPLKLAGAGRLDDVLHLLTKELLQLMPKATRSALVLNDRAGGGLILKSWSPDAEPGFSTTLARRAMTQREGFIWQFDSGDISASIRNHNIGTGMYAPLIWRDLVLGVICVDDPQRNELFLQDDLRLMVAVANYAAMAVANFLAQDDLLRHSDLMSRMISSRFSPDARARLMHDAVMGLLPLGTRKSHICVLVSDIRGFTKLTSEIGAQRASDLLNDFFPPLIDAIHANKGTIEKFAGDAIFAVFGSPDPDDQQHEHAVRAALAMKAAAAEVMRARAAKKLEVCEMGIGIECGEALHGFIGNANWLEFTVIGTPANFASRYCNGAGPGEILISPDVYGRVVNKFKCEKTQIETKHEGNFPAFRVKDAI